MNKREDFNSRTGKIKKYIDTDVLTEAKKRMHHVYDIFDTVVVLFSGGKDSLAALSLTHEVALERGLTEPIKAIFWDMEFFTKDIVNYVAEVREWDWVDLRWCCLRMPHATLVLDETMPLLPFDPTRGWLRQPPAFAEWPMGDEVWSKKDRDHWLAKQYDGLVATVTGVRAAESLVRLRSSVNKKTDNYICSTESNQVKSVKPLFDWLDMDVYKYIHDTEGIDLPLSYQMSMLVNMPMKTSTITHRNASKYLDKIKFVDPELYENMVAYLPWSHAQATYWKDIDMEGILARYGKSYALVRLWIDQNLIDPTIHATAVSTFEAALHRAEESPWAYTPLRVLKHFLYGNFGGTIQPSSDERNKFIKENYD